MAGAPHPLYPALKLGQTSWDWSRPYLLGVVNLTPDSFSDGGRFDDPDRAVDHALRLIDEGADALDLGGESTRPGAAPVSVPDEIRRVVPVIERLAARVPVPLSVDTTKVAVARAALSAGACVVNDVGVGDPRGALAATAARAGAAFIAMHARGTPSTMGTLVDYADVVADVSEDLLRAAREVVAAGVPRGRVLLDPGVGFAKTGGQSLALLARLDRLCALGYPVCVGVSRKSFIVSRDAHPEGWTRDESPALERVGGTAAAVAVAVLRGAAVLRVHDVALMRQAARVAHALRAA